MKWSRSCLLSMGLSVVGVSSAGATADFPGVVRTKLGLATTPDCILCHATQAGGNGTATRPFGMTMRSFGVTAFNSPALRTALDRVVSDNVDNNGNGVNDVADLQAGRNPNVTDPVVDADGGVVVGADAGGGGGGGNVDVVEPPSFGCSSTRSAGSNLGLCVLVLGLIAARSRSRSR